MKSFKAPEPSHSAERPREDAAQRMAALIRLITYARDEAKRLDADVLLFCLDAAVAAAREKRKARGSEPKRAGDTAARPHKKVLSGPVH